MENEYPSISDEGKVDSLDFVLSEIVGCQVNIKNTVKTGGNYIFTYVNSDHNVQQIVIGAELFAENCKLRLSRIEKLNKAWSKK